MKIIPLPSDEPMVRLVATWLFEEFGKADPANSVDRSIQRLKTQFVSSDDVLGTASMIRHDMNDRMDLSPWLGAVYVAPAFRGKGVASQLCKQVEQELRALTFSKAYLFTIDRQSLYLRNGWELAQVLSIPADGTPSEKLRTCDKVRESDRNSLNS